MNKITSAQFCSLLLITDAFTLFCLIGSVSLITVSAFACSAALQFVMAIPLAKFYANGIKSGKPSQIFYFIYLILWGGVLFNMLWSTSKAIYIPYENSGGIRGKLLIAGIIAAVCLYISSTGIKTLARAALIAAAVGALCIIIVSVSAVAGSDMKNIVRAEADRGFVTELVKSLALSGGLGSFTVLLGLTKGKTLPNAAKYFLGKLILTSVIILTATLVAGGIMKITDFPIVTAAQLSQPFSSQRIDSLFLIIFSIFAVFSIAVQSMTAAYLLKEIFPKFKKYRSCTVILLIIGAAFLLAKTDKYSIIYAVAPVTALLIIPLLSALYNKTVSNNNKHKRRQAR